MTLPPDIAAWIAQRFPADRHAEAAALLRNARIEDGSVPPPRLLRCTLIGSGGDLAQLRRLVAHLAVDWRDVVVAGEYELRDGRAVPLRDLSQPLQP